MTAGTAMATRQATFGSSPDATIGLKRTDIMKILSCALQADNHCVGLRNLRNKRDMKNLMQVQVSGSRLRPSCPNRQRWHLPCLQPQSAVVHCLEKNRKSVFILKGRLGDDVIQSPLCKYPCFESFFSHWRSPKLYLFHDDGQSYMANSAIIPLLIPLKKGGLNQKYN